MISDLFREEDVQTISHHFDGSARKKAVAMLVSFVLGVVTVVGAVIFYAVQRDFYWALVVVPVVFFVASVVFLMKMVSSMKSRGLDVQQLGYENLQRMQSRRSSEEDAVHSEKASAGAAGYVFAHDVESGSPEAVEPEIADPRAVPDVDVDGDADGEGDASGSSGND